MVSRTGSGGGGALATGGGVFGGGGGDPPHATATHDANTIALTERPTPIFMTLSCARTLGLESIRSVDREAEALRERYAKSPDHLPSFAQIHGDSAKSDVS
jgi:hypothetical protein